MSRLGNRWDKKPRRALLAEHLAVTLHRRERHPKGRDDLRLGSASIVNQLAGEKAEGSQILLFMHKHRQVPVEIDHLSIALLEGEF